MSPRIEVIEFCYVPLSNVGNVSVDGVMLKSTVYFSAGGWIKLNLTIGTMDFSETKKDTDEGILYEQEFEGTLPGKDRVSQLNINEVCKEPVIVKLKIADGAELIIGKPNSPVRLFSKTIHSSNKISISFKRETEIPACELG